MTPELLALAEIARQAAGVARSGRPEVVEEKSSQDFVTDMDRRLEQQIGDALRERFPGVPVFGEESLADDEHIPGSVFLVDPLDGTGNWMASLPFSAVSIARIEAGRTVLGVVADIWRGPVYAAQEGAGSWRDDERLAVPAAGSGLMCLSTGLLDAADGTAVYKGLRRFGKLRNLGSQALQLCAVAQGTFVLVASLEARLWDDAAGRLIATEAGARYRATVPAADTTRPAARQRSLCAHPGIFDAAAALLAPVYSSDSAVRTKP